jgi:uncharacterized protein
LKVLLILSIILFLYSLSLILFGNNFTIHAQQDLQTIKYRNMVIDLGNGVKTNAQLTIPAVGNGPFPGILLVHGSGATDMNETLGFVHIDNETDTKIYPSARPFFQIAEYLSDRGFVVLRYDKRGVDGNFTILDTNVWGNATTKDFKQDAEKALNILIQQPEVDANRITVLGHSEGATIAPRVAIDNPDKVKNIVLMGTLAQNFSKIAEFQGVSLPLLNSKKVLDHTQDGLLSLQEANENPVFTTMVGNLTLLLTQNITNNASYTTPTNASTPSSSSLSQQLNPKYNTNNDVYVDIDKELKPKLLEHANSLSIVKSGEKCIGIGKPCPIWVRAGFALESNLDIIGNVSFNTSILILQGENETQTPIEQAFLLQQKLTDVRHPDHTLITYPNLGHVFYPSSEWQTGIGPIEQYVLRDLYSWLESHSGLIPLTTSISSSYTSNTTKINN